MTLNRSNAQGAAQFLNQGQEERTPVRRLFGLAAAMALGVALVIVLRDEAAPIVLGVFALFAALGVAALFAIAAGLLSFGAKAQGGAPDLARVYAENVAHGIAITGKDGSTIYANPAYHQFAGVSAPSHFSVETALVRNLGGSEPLFRLIRAARRGETATEEFQALGAPRAGRWLRASVQRVPGPKAGVNADWVCLWEIADITARRQEETQLADRARELRAMLDHLPAGIFWTRPDGHVSFVNRALREWTNLGDPEEGEAPHLSALFPDHAARMLEGGEADNGPVFAFDIVKGDGTAMPVTVLIAKRAQNDGETEGEAVIGAVVERHGAIDGDAPQDRLEELFALLKSAPIPVAAVSREGRFNDSNPAFARFFGASANRPSLFDLVDEGTRERLHQAIDKAAARKAAIPPVDISTTEAKRTGRLFFSPLARAGGGENAALVFGIDISEQRMLEEQIAQSQKLQAIGQLAGGIAHDFNNVLTAIIGFSDLLLANHRPSDPSFADIMNIKTNANRAAGLVRHLLAFSRKQTLRPQVLSLTDALEDLMVLIDQLLGEKIKGKVVHGRDLWLVKVDPTQFQQVVINLAVNARDAMPGGGELTIRTSNIGERESTKLGHAHMEPGEYVLCEVSDTGTGIPPEVMDKIFEPFFSTKEVGKGTGLGLSTVYGIVKQTGGYIFAESEVGVGTTFKIYLPRCEEAIAAAGIAAEKPAKKEASRDLTGSATVLLVEDEDAVRSFAARALATRGYKVLEAASGVQALDVMSEHGGDVDIVVSDVVMPEMDGPTLLKHLRRTNPQIKIIFVSGYAEEAFRNNLDESEKFTFLPKPFSLKKLAAAVKETLEAD
jgi:two-component system cell cycle sensor histidine kinase/response regulator CckA